MRRMLRDIDAKMIMGKNTHMKAAISALMAEPKPNDEDYEERIATYKPRPYLAQVKDLLKLNIGMIMTNGDFSTVKEILDTQVREAPAKVGALAPKQVVVQPGPTGMDPKQTGFFQALNIATKIVRAQIEIVNPVTIISEGDKIGQSQAALLDKLKIRPFEYKMNIKKILDNGKIYDAKVLSITNDDILGAMSSGIANLTSLSLSTGYTIPSATPHLIIAAFKNLAGAAIAADYSFPAVDALKAAAAAGPAAGASGAATGGDAKKEDDKKEESEEEEDIDMGGMFGDEDEY